MSFSKKNLSQELARRGNVAWSTQSIYHFLKTVFHSYWRSHGIPFMIQ